MNLIRISFHRMIVYQKKNGGIQPALAEGDCLPEGKGVRYNNKES